MPFGGLGSNVFHKDNTKNVANNQGKTDLLLRFFDSQFFDEWIAITYLYKSSSSGVQDYLCNRLYSLPEHGIERYLSQLCQFVVQRPNSALDRVVVDLCARSLRIAVKTYWLLLAISQDNPKNKFVADVRDRCETAALEGYWEPPFRDTKLLPLSPTLAPGRNSFTSPPISPNGWDHDYSRNRSLDEYSSLGGNFSFTCQPVEPMRPIRERFGSPEARGRERYGSPEPGRVSPDGLGQGIYSCQTVGQRIEQITYYSTPLSAGESTAGSPRAPVDTRPLSPAQRDRHSKLQLELGEGEGVTSLLERSYRSDGLVANRVGEADNILSPPNSPRLRQTTFGATLDFVEALCTASSGLTAFNQEDRPWALRRTLEGINREIESTARKGVAIWFPMGRRNDRVVSLVAKEVVILNSREKAPFLLYVEVLNSDALPVDDDDGDVVADRMDLDAIASPPAPYTTEVEQPPTPHSAVNEQGFESYIQSINHPSSAIRALAFDQEQKENITNLPQQAEPPSSSSAQHQEPHRPRARGPVHQNSRGKLVAQQVEDSFTMGLKSALAGLRGEGPLVSVRLEVLNDCPLQHSPAGPRPVSPQTPHSMHSNADTATTSVQELAQESSFNDWVQGDGSTCTPPHEPSACSTADASKPIGGLLCRWGLCRRIDTDGDGEGCPTPYPYVRLHLQVIGGVDLRIRNSPAKHRRVPSLEALQRMAAQHRTTVPRDGGGVDGAASAGLGGHDNRAGPSGSSTGSGGRGGSPPSTASLYDPERARAIQAAMEHLDQDQSAAATASMTARQKHYEQLLQRQQEAQEVYGERFISRKDRIRTDSPHGRRPGWDLRAVIVKTGDDCRQELLAVQLIQTLQDIFMEASLPLWLRPFEVLVTSNRTALIEMITDTLSIHSLKSKGTGMSLRQHFCDKFIEGSPDFHKAQRNFVESMAAYSLVSYLLQIKDRHNGNILMDDEGHVIHIDFGFMLSNSPGGVNFESAPFKLTREYLEVMDSNSEGTASSLFDYFKVLMIHGFLVCRKHADRIILLVEMMQNSGCPCFKAGNKTVMALRRRFHLSLPDTQCVEMVLGLISESLDAWRTRQYDYYQRILNGIL